ncbi:MAG: pilin, partial [Patescibacteria group bacterium]
LKNKNLYWKLFLLISFFIFWGALLIGQAKADSCKCFKENTNGKSTVVINNQECQTGVSINSCQPSNFGLQGLTCENPAGGYHTQVCTKVTCQFYRDNNCTEVVGTKDPTSKFNPCWTKQQCQDSDGIFDTLFCSNDQKKECNKDDDCGNGNKCRGLNSASCEPFAGQSTSRCFVKTPPISLQVGIPGLGKTVEGGFPGYLAAFYKFFIGFLAVAAVVMIMWGGFKRIAAAGSAESIKNANSTIISAIVGLIIALISYSLLQLINPRLVQLTGMNIDKIKTEIAGNWCPDPDPSDKNKHYYCGDQARINGLDCVGSVCSEEGKGCYKVSTSGDTSSQGLSADYKCLTKQEACRSITEDNIESLHGIDTKDLWTSSGEADALGAYNQICKRYSTEYIDCLWVHYPGGTSKCEPYAKETQRLYCQGSEDGSVKDDCGDFDVWNPVFDITGEVLGGKDFAACAYDWCNLGCRAISKQVTGLQAVPNTTNWDLISREYVCQGTN